MTLLHCLWQTVLNNYVGILLGANKIGIGVALINYNLRENSLHHSITVAECVALIYENSLEEAVNNIHDQLDENLQIMCFCACGNANTSYGQSFDSKVESMLDTLPLVEKNLSSKGSTCSYRFCRGKEGIHASNLSFTSWIETKLISTWKYIWGPEATLESIIFRTICQGAYLQTPMIDSFPSLLKSCMKPCSVLS